MNVKNKKTYYQIILDKSGSMNDCVASTINGFNEQMQLIKSMKEKYPDQEFFVSLTTFNKDISFDIDIANPDHVKELVSSVAKVGWLKSNDNIVYNPSGMTALYDAIGNSIKRIRKTAENEIKNDEATVVVVIMTDGHENSSTEYSYSQIQSMIKELESSENWTFSYLSSTIDAVDYAVKMNIRRENAIMFSKSNLKGTFNDMSHSLSSYFDKKQKNIKEKQFFKRR